MQKQITVRIPRVNTTLPAHEQAARRERVRRTTPVAPGRTSPKKRTPVIHHTGRQTLDTRILYNPFAQGLL